MSATVLPQLARVPCPSSPAGPGVTPTILSCRISVEDVFRLWVAIDLLAVLVFVAIGRSVHDHGINGAGLASTVWPFIVGLSIGWLVVIALGRVGTSLSDGVIVAVTTVAVGMILRAVAGQGVAFAFILVALGFLGAFMLGGRAVLGGLRHMRSKRPAG